MEEGGKRGREGEEGRREREKEGGKEEDKASHNRRSALVHHSVPADEY